MTTELFNFLVLPFFTAPLIILSILEMVAFAFLIHAGQKRFSVYPKLFTFLLVWLGGGVLFGGLEYATYARSLRIQLDEPFLTFLTFFSYMLGFTVLPLGITVLLHNQQSPKSKWVSFLSGVCVAVFIVPFSYLYILCRFFDDCLNI
jgi:hypothetical protein